MLKLRCKSTILLHNQFSHTNNTIFPNHQTAFLRIRQLHIFQNPMATSARYVNQNNLCMCFHDFFYVPEVNHIVIIVIKDYTYVLEVSETTTKHMYLGREREISTNDNII